MRVSLDEEEEVDTDAGKDSCWIYLAAISKH